MSGRSATFAGFGDDDDGEVDVDEADVGEGDVGEGDVDEDVVMGGVLTKEPKHSEGQVLLRTRLITTEEPIPLRMRRYSIIDR